MKHSLRTAAALCLLVLMTFTAVCPAWADDTDMDYEGELDIESGRPVGEEGSASEKTRISLGSAVYDMNTRQYRYTVGTTEVGMSLPSGVVTTGKVSVFIPDGMIVKVYRDGQEDEEQELTAITEPGAYVLRFGDDVQESLTFTIVKELTGRLNEYRMPEGFRVTSVTLNAQEVKGPSNLVDMTAEGNYDIRYRCDRTGNTLSLTVTVDHTPPTLRLEAVNEKGYASGPVDISDLEKGTAVSVYLNDERIDYAETLTGSGRYRIVLQDKAGNRTEYNFTIRVYFNFNAVMFVLLLVGLAAAVVVYIVLSRRRLRIR